VVTNVSEESIASYLLSQGWRRYFLQNIGNHLQGYMAMQPRKPQDMRFEVSTAVTMMMMMFFWVSAPCGLDGRSQPTRRPNPEEPQIFNSKIYPPVEKMAYSARLLSMLQVLLFSS
jgi:hypothetical protein